MTADITVLHEHPRSPDDPDRDGLRIPHDPPYLWRGATISDR
jgi:hypothetical protein